MLYFFRKNASKFIVYNYFALYFINRFHKMFIM